MAWPQDAQPAPNFGYTFGPQPTERDLRTFSRAGMFDPQRQAQTAATPADADPYTFFQRMTGAVRGFLNGFWTPGAPLPVIPPDGTPPRAYDYPITFNVDIEPRAEVGIKFPELIALANNWDIGRMIIERRKEQVSKIPWTVEYADPDKDPDDDTAAIQALLEYPDHEHDFGAFLRAMLEEVLVKDALAIQPVFEPGQARKVYGLYGIDGASIQLKLDERGRVPLPPNAAYQQVIKGVPWSNFTTDDLLYSVLCYRFHSPWGFSKIEQLYILANTALRRQSQQLYAFTDGTIPAMLMDTPQGWIPQQIAEFQQRFDSRYMGNLKARSRVTFVPNGSKPMPFTADPLKNEFDEWMAWCACFAFGISKEGFTKMMNRGTAASAKEQAAEEGLEPLLRYLESVWTKIIRRFFGRPDIIFRFHADAERDPLEENQIAMAQIEHGVYALDDFLKDQGKDPIGVGYVFKTPQGFVSVEAWKANGGITPAAPSVPSASDGGEEGATPGAPSDPADGEADEPEDPGAKAAKAALPAGHLARLPFPRPDAKKNSKRLY